MNGYTMQITYLLVVFAIVVQHTFAGTFPKVIQKCKVSDPKFEECVLNSANNFISTVAKGDEKYNIPPLMMEESIQTYNLTENFHFKITNLSINFNESFAFRSIHFDFEKKLLTFVAQSNQTHYESTYEADGEILGKPAHESGKSNVTLDYIELNATVPLDFKMKDDKKYLEAVSCTLVVTIKNFQFKPYDQVTVGEPMTAEQKEVYQSYLDKLPEVIKEDDEKQDTVIVDILNTLFGLLPFDEIFLP